MVTDHLRPKEASGVQKLTTLITNLSQLTTKVTKYFSITSPTSRYRTSTSKKKLKTKLSEKETIGKVT